MRAKRHSEQFARPPIRYLQHPQSGALDCSDMGRSWAAVREPVAAGTLRANDKGLVDVIFRWEQLLRSRASCIPSLLTPLTTAILLTVLTA